MSTRFHSKYHRHNHHTDPTADVRFPDSSHDPIASPDSPFRGTFALNGVLSAYTSLSAYTGYIANPNTALILRGGTWALVADQGNTYVRDLTCRNIAITHDFTLEGNAYFKQNVSIVKSLTVGTNTFYASSTANKVGIGTTQPNQALTVVGNISATQGLYSNNIFEVNPTTSKISLKAYTEISNNATVTGNTGLSGELTVNGITTLNNDLNAVSNALFVENSNRFVGINTAIPSKQLTVNGEILVTDTAIFDKDVLVSTDAFVVNTTNRRVGIGTNVPNEKLTVVGNISATDSILIHRNAHINIPADYWSGDTYIGLSNHGQVEVTSDSTVSFTANGYMDTAGNWVSLSAYNIFNLAGAAQISLDASGTIDLNTEAVKETGSVADVETRLRVTPFGDVGINTKVPNEKLTVVGNISATGQIAASALFVNVLDLTPVNVDVICTINTFSTPVTASGEFLIVQLNGTQKAIRLWNF